jgi:hypothetical protein
MSSPSNHPQSYILYADVASISLTRIERLLTSNEVPTLSETPYMSSLIAESQSRLDDSRRRAFILRQVLRELEEEGGQIEAQLNQRRATLSAIRKIPTELLQAIFLEYNEITAKDYSLVCRHRLANGPWALGQVCQTWRASAVAYHRLWSKIYLKRPGTADRDIRLLVSLIEEGLHRAGDELLTFHIDLGSEIDDPPATASIINVFVSHSSRWYDAALFFSLDACNTIRQIRSSFYSLRHLSLRLYDGFTDEEQAAQIGTIEGFSNAMELRTISVEGIAFPEAIHLPWHLLTHVRAVSTPYARLHPIAIFLQCTNLASVDLDFSYQFFLPATTRIVTNRTIKRIYMASYFAQLFPKLSLPGLTSLQLEYSASQTSPTLSATAPLSEMLTRSRCTLTKLVFSYTLVHRDMISILSLSSMNHLEEFILDLDEFLQVNGDHDWFISLLKFLTISRHVDPQTGLPPPIKLPRLRILRFRIYTCVGEMTCEGWDQTTTSPKHKCIKWLGPELLDLMESRVLLRDLDHMARLEEVDVRLGFVAHLPYWYNNAERIKNIKEQRVKVYVGFDQSQSWPYEQHVIDTSSN